MVFAADTLRDILFANWNLTGDLAKVESDNMKEIVQFFAYPQIAGNEVSKAITVQKINAETDENVITHPTFTEIQDIYEVTIYYRTTDVQIFSRDEAFSNIESMATEILRILDTVYDPSSGIGIYYQVQRNWTREDDYNTAQPDMRRRLRFMLTTIESENDEVFTGVNSLLVYDRSQGTGIQPGADYIYTEINDVKSAGGFNLIKRLTRQNPGIAKRATGLYTGTYDFETMAKESDITGSTTNLIDELGTLLNNGEVAEVFLIKKTTNKDGRTMNHTTRMQIIDTQCLFTREDLAKFKLRGEVIAPPVFTVT